jgi:hypothetical protein
MHANTLRMFPVILYDESFCKSRIKHTGNTIELRKYCKNICKLYKAYKDEFSGGYYSEGYKRCV